MEERKRELKQALRDSTYHIRVALKVSIADGLNELLSHFDDVLLLH